MLKNRSIAFDFILSLIITILIGFLLFILFNMNDPFYFLYNSSVISVFMNLFISIFGIFAIIMTLLTVFEQSFKDNQTFKILRKNDQYIEIYERYWDSILVILVGIFILCLFFVVLENKELVIPCINLIFILNAILFLIILFSIIRIYRCFKLFHLLKDAIKRTSKK
jgi:Na+/alanine symporter